MSMTLLFLIFLPQGGFYLKAIVTPSPMQIRSLPVHGWQPVWRGLARRCTRSRLEKGRFLGFLHGFACICVDTIWNQIQWMYGFCIDNKTHLYSVYHSLEDCQIFSPKRTHAFHTFDIGHRWLHTSISFSEDIPQTMVVCRWSRVSGLSYHQWPPRQNWMIGDRW